MFPCGRYAETVIKEVVISGTISSYLMYNTLHVLTLWPILPSNYLCTKVIKRGAENEIM